VSKLIVAPEEREDEFLIRVYQAKDELNLTWDEIADIMNANFDKDLCTSTWQKKYYKAKTTGYCCKEDRDDTYSERDYDEDLESAQLRYALKDQTSQVNAQFRRMSREQTIIDIAHDFASQMSVKKMLRDPAPIKINKESNSAVLLISDWHYGIEIDNYWNTYNPDIAKERVSRLVELTLEKCYNNNIKTLSVMNLGDMIAGNIHLQLRINSRMDVISQIMEVSELIAEMLYEFSKSLKVRYTSCLDNHSRIDPNKKESLQLESLCRITDWYLKDRFADNKNITFVENVFGEDICSESGPNWSVIGVHGDKDKPKNMIDKLGEYTKMHWDVICSAHLHHFSADESNNTMRVSNGSLMGTDEYASSLRLNSKPSQTLLTFNGTGLDQIYKLNLDV